METDISERARDSTGSGADEGALQDGEILNERLNFGAVFRSGFEPIRGFGFGL